MEKTEEIVLFGRTFAPKLIPADAVVRCASCGLVDPTRLGHLPSDCLLAMKLEIGRLRGLLELPQPRKSLEN